MMSEKRGIKIIQKGISTNIYDPRVLNCPHRHSIRVCCCLSYLQFGNICQWVLNCTVRPCSAWISSLFRIRYRVHCWFRWYNTPITGFTYRNGIACLSRPRSSGGVGRYRGARTGYRSENSVTKRGNRNHRTRRRSWWCTLIERKQNWENYL